MPGFPERWCSPVGNYRCLAQGHVGFSGADSVLDGLERSDALSEDGGLADLVDRSSNSSGASFGEQIGCPAVAVREGGGGGSVEQEIAEYSGALDVVIEHGRGDTFGGRYGYPFGLGESSLSHEHPYQVSGGDSVFAFGGVRNMRMIECCSCGCPGEIGTPMAAGRSRR
ncbi:hypothetical protein, partial [Sciscionella sediminilitoris]|uniref:hypothetical protein n=1 Tax=Sciscionella sediminilitoris TaxID=1445613 RepID=UPI0012E1870A